MGLFSDKNKNLESKNEIITYLSLIPLKYKGDINFIKHQINNLISQYPKYTNYLLNYFMTSKLKFFQDGSYDHSKYPEEIISNSILERYNKYIKKE